MAFRGIPTIAPGPIGRPTGATNVVTNGGLETNTTGWAAIGTNTIARSIEQAHSGAASLKVTYQDAASPMAAFQPPLVITDDLYTFHYWVYVPAAWDGGQIRIRNGATIGAFTGSTATDENYANMALVDQWQRISCVVNPDAGDLSGRLDVCAASAPTAGRFIYVDDAQVELGSVATPYIATDGASASRQPLKWVA